jgi:phycocyanobilin lyase alpha subunit
MTVYDAETAIAHLNQKEDLSLRYYAAWWLGKCRVTDEAAISALLNALEDEADRSPDGGYPLRRNAARALGKLGDKQAVSLLIENLSCSDYYVREACAQALEEIGDPQAIPHLRDLLAGGVEAAEQVPGKPHLVQPYEAIIEALGTLGATEAQAEIEPFLEHSVEKVQFATARALYQLTGEDEYGQRLMSGLQAEKLPLRRSALMDLGATDYFPAADAIAQTPAENSLKLIALKGILENYLPNEKQELSKEAVHLLELMDSLL